MAQVRYMAGEVLFGRALPVWKRAIDIVGAAAGLVLLSPLLLATAVFIKMVSHGPVLFVQPRVGYLGREFRMYKFRTMHAGADPGPHREHLVQLIKECGSGNGSERARPMAKLGGDSRIIPFGEILRRLCLDELPQLFNVLRGDMTLVGPRPAIPYEADAYARWHAGRFDGVPGITGLWQVSGKNRLTFCEMVSLDIRYIRDLSFRLDIRIMVRTLPAIFGLVKDYLRRK